MSVAAPPLLERSTPPAEPSPTVEPRRVAGWTFLGIAALTAVAAALRLEGIGTWYWVDEALSVGIARHGLTEIPHLLLRDGSPPLWYLLLHVWTGAFGTSATATHALSLVFGLATVPVGWLVGRRLFGTRAAWFVAALAAVSPFVTYFARETRMYSLVVVLSMLVAWSFVEAFVDSNPRARWWFAVALLALLYTHNWGLYTGVGCAATLVPIGIARRDVRGVARAAVGPFVLVALGYLPWLPSLLSQIRNTGAPWSFTPSARDVVRELAALFRDERVLVGLVLAAGVGLVPLGRRWRSRDALAIGSLVVLAVVPVTIGWALAHVEPSWATRYLAVVVAPLLVVVGVGLARAKGVGVACLALSALLIVQPITRIDGMPLPRSVKSNAREMAALMAPRLSNGDLVVVVQPEAVPLARIELGPGLRYADPTGLVRDPTMMDWRDAEARLRRASYERDIVPLLDDLHVGERVLVVGPANKERATDTSWIRSFRAKGRQIESALRGDDRFALVDRVGGDGTSYVDVEAVVYERVK